MNHEYFIVCQKYCIWICLVLDGYCFLILSRVPIISSQVEFKIQVIDKFQKLKKLRVLNKYRV